MTPFAKALSISFGCHLVLAAFLLFANFSFTPKPTPNVNVAPVEPIKAVVVERKEIEQQLNKIREDKAAEQRRVAAAEKARRDKARKAELAKKRKEEKARERKKEQERLALEAKKKKAAEEKARREAEAKRRKKLEDDKRKKAAEEKARKEREEKARKERLAKEKAEKAAKEQAARQQARQRQVVSERDKFASLIKHVITSNLLTDKATMQGKSCRVKINLSPSGYVINVTTLGGDQVICRATLNAIKQSGNLPVSKDPEVFELMREISLTVAPEFN